MIVRTSFVLASLATIVLSVAGPAASQQVGPPGTPVQMIVSVEPKKGNETPTITQDELIVYQGKDRRPVTGWVPAKGNNAGVALAVLIDDDSGFSIGTQLNDIRNFINQQAPTTQVAVGYMQNGTVALTQTFTLDHAAAAKSVRLAQGFFGINASPYISLSDFVKRWQPNPSTPRREVLMITSGIDTLYTGAFDDPYLDAAVRDAQCAGVVVYSIYTPAAGHFGHSYFRTYWGQNYLSELSEETGGESYYFLGPQAPVNFTPYLNKLTAQLSNQYLLRFMAQPEKKAGPQPVRLMSEIHSVDFVYANRVCVPASPAQ